MSAGYRAISWNPQKKKYDLILVAGLSLYLGTFVGLSSLLNPNATAETVLIRAIGTAGFLLLNVILCIGPLCRLSSKFLPLLYNRRHLGVTMFLLALSHGAFSIVQFHAQGDVSPILSIFISTRRFNSVTDFPFQQLGAVALFILFLMAATSHDFWLRNLTAPVWKRLHMAVYIGYALLVAHIALGALQSEHNPVLAATLIGSVVAVCSLHLAAARKELGKDSLAVQTDRFIEVCRVADIKDSRARIVFLSGERVAIFKYDGKLSAVSNVCQHQNGPLGEGRVIDGCITCPWHGYQYLPDCGSAPPPFTEKIPTFNLQLIDDRILVDPKPNAPGTRVEPIQIPAQRGVSA